MSEGRRGLLSLAWGCIASPRGTLRSIQGSDLWKGVAIILILASLSSWAGFVYASKVPAEPLEERLPHLGRIIRPRAFGGDLTAVSALRDGLEVVSGWLIPSVVLHLSASLIWEGSLGRMLALTGFASIPLAFQQILRLLDAYTISGEAILSIREVQTPGGPLALKLASEATSVFNVFGLWAFALTVVAASVNYNTTIRRAAPPVVLAYLSLVVIRLLTPL